MTKSNFLCENKGSAVLPLMTYHYESEEREYDIEDCLNSGRVQDREKNCQVQKDGDDEDIQSGEYEQLDNQYIIQKSLRKNPYLNQTTVNNEIKELQLDFVEDEEDQAERYLKKMKTLKAEKRNKRLSNDEEEAKLSQSEVSSSSSSSSSSSEDSEEIHDEVAAHNNVNMNANSKSHNNFQSNSNSMVTGLPIVEVHKEKVPSPHNAVIQCQPEDTGNVSLNPNVLSPADKKQAIQKKRRVTVVTTKKLLINGASAQNVMEGVKKKGTVKKKRKEDSNMQLTKAKSTFGQNRNAITPNDLSIEGLSPNFLKKEYSVSPLLKQTQIQSTKTKNQLTRKRKLSLFDNHKNDLSYCDMVMTDKQFRQTYADNLCQAIFTFPQFRRNYSKNYSKVQASYTKVSKKRKTIVFDIDETLVYATHCMKEIPVHALDTTIRIKANKYGGSIKAYLSFRPHLIEMLIELYQDFELILYTCGTSEYAKSFSKAVHELFFEKYAQLYYNVPSDFNQKEFKFFDHVLSLQQCLYSYENDLYIKDLKILELGRNLQDVVIVDNNVQSFFLQLTNGIPIYDYEGDKDDRALLPLTNYLKGFLHEPDVRTKINQDFQIMKILEQKGTLKQVE